MQALGVRKMVQQQQAGEPLCNGCMRSMQSMPLQQLVRKLSRAGCRPAAGQTMLSRGKCPGWGSKPSVAAFHGTAKPAVAPLHNRSSITWVMLMYGVGALRAVMFLKLAGLQS